MKRSIQFENIVNLSEFILNEVNENKRYARRVNREILDVAELLAYTVSETVYGKYINNVNISRDDMMMYLRNLGDTYTSYNLHPIDTITIGDKLPNNEYGYGKFINKYQDEHKEGTIPIYYRFKYNSNDRTDDELTKMSDERRIEFDLDSIKRQNTSDKAGYLLRPYNNSYSYTSFSSSKIIIEIYEPCVDDIISTMRNGDEDENMKNIYTIMAHEMQHAFDDYIIFKKSSLQNKKRNLMYHHNIDDENDKLLYNLLDKRERIFVDAIIYFLSDKEVSARLQEVSSWYSYCVNNDKLKNEFRDIVDKLNNIKWIEADGYNNRRILSQPPMFNIMTIISCLCNSNIFSMASQFTTVNNLFMSIKHMNIIGNKSIYRELLMVGYYLFKSNKLKYSINSDFNKNIVSDMLSYDKLEVILKGEKDYGDYLYIAQFIQDNILYWLSDYVMQVYHILTSELREMFGILYCSELNMNNMLNENRRLYIQKSYFDYIM